MQINGITINFILLFQKPLGNLSGYEWLNRISEITINVAVPKANNPEIVNKTKVVIESNSIDPKPISNLIE